MSLDSLMESDEYGAALDPLTALPAWVKGEKRLSSMLPYVSLVTDSTIRTCGNELMQCIRLEGVNSITSEEHPLYPRSRLGVIAEDVANTRVTFRGTTLQLSDGAVGAKFGAIFAVKNYPARTDSLMLDELNLPVDMVVTHSFVPINSNIMAGRIKRQLRLMQAANDGAVMGREHQPDAESVNAVDVLGREVDRARTTASLSLATRGSPTTRQIDIRVNALARQEDALLACGVDPAHVVRAALRRAVKGWQLAPVHAAPCKERRTRMRKSTFSAMISQP